jgi:uncharacterized protein with PIN domain
VRVSVEERSVRLKFVVDGMLGGLARWLRMLGYETEYDAKTNDNKLLEMLQEEGTVLLTKDEELYHRAETRKLLAVLVKGESEEQRLGQLAKSISISLNIEMATTRCPQCGSQLHEISKEEASSSVPEKSLKLYDKFWRCSNSECAKTYWIGSHWKRIHQTLDEARRIASQN